MTKGNGGQKIFELALILNMTATEQNYDETL